MIDDLHLTGNKYNVGLTVFYILYVLIDSKSRASSYKHTADA